MHLVTTRAGEFHYEPVELYHGRKQIDLEVSKNNLLSFKSVLDAAEVKFGLIYGTLLGAVRDGSFIEWDEDIDVYVLKKDLQDFLDSLWGLKSEGFELVRCDGDLYSVMRDDDYIDIYVFEEKGKRMFCNADMVKSEFLCFEEKVEFLGEKFYCPKAPKLFLKVMYGSDWETPKKNFPAQPWTLWRRFRSYVGVCFPFLKALKKKYS